MGLAITTDHEKALRMIRSNMTPFASGADHSSQKPSPDTLSTQYLQNGEIVCPLRNAHGIQLLISYPGCKVFLIGLLACVIPP